MFLFMIGSLVWAQEPNTEQVGTQPVRVPFVVTVPDVAKQNASVEELALMVEFAGIASARLSYYVEYPFVLPKSMFSGVIFDEGLIKETDLQAVPIADSEEELSDLAFDKEGNRYRLSAEQKSDIRQRGGFSVASKKSPEKTYDWQLSGILQKGTLPTFNSYKNNLTWGLGRLSVHLPSRLFLDEPFSIRRGLADTGTGLWGLSSLLVGLPESHGDFPEKEDWVKDWVDQRVLILQKEFLVVNGGSDPRLLNPEEQKALMEILLLIEQEVQREWRANQDNLQLKFWKKGEETGLVDRDLKRYVSNRTTRHHNTEVVKRIIQNSLLISRFGEQLTQRTAQIYRASVLRQSSASEQYSKIEAYREEAEENRLKKHPIRGSVDSWLYKKVEEDVQNFILEHQNNWESMHISKLEEEEGTIELELQRIRNQVLHVDYAKWKKQALQEWKTEKKKRPAKKFRLPKYHWNPKSVYIKDKNTGEEKYRLQQYSLLHADTTKPFWRLSLIGKESLVWGSNNARWLLRESVWNGRFGLRSQFGDLFGLKSFYPDKTVDQNTGVVIDDKNGRKVWTYGSRLRSVWTRIRASRKRFESTKDDKFIPKNVARVFHVGWNYGIRGPVESIFVGVGQPILTVGTVGINGTLGLTSYLWSPALAVAKHGFNLTIYDTNSPKYTSIVGHYPQVLPLPRMLLWNVGMKGVGQVGLSTAWGGVVEPSLFASATVLGSARYATRSIYDVLSYGLIILPFGRVPAQEGFFVHNVEGPGVLEQRLLHLDSGLALLALQARLEKEELDYFQRHHQREIDSPLKEYQSFLQGILSPFSIQAKANPESLVKARKHQRKALSEEVDKRSKRLRSMIYIPSVEYIRQTDVERRKTKLWGGLLCEEYYTKKIFPYLSDEEKSSFWSSMTLKKGDWNGLSERFLEEVFSEYFFETLDSREHMYVISVSHPHLSDYFERLLHDIPKEKYIESVGSFEFVQAKENNAFPLEPVVVMDDIIDYISLYSDE